MLDQASRCIYFHFPGQNVRGVNATSFFAFLETICYHSHSLGAHRLRIDGYASNSKLFLQNSSTIGLLIFMPPATTHGRRRRICRCLLCPHRLINKILPANILPSAMKV